MKKYILVILVIIFCIFFMYRQNSNTVYIGKDIDAITDIITSPVKLASIEVYREFKPSNVYYLDGKEFNMSRTDKVDKDSNIAFSNEDISFNISLLEPIGIDRFRSYIKVEPKLNLDIDKSEEDNVYVLKPTNWELNNEAKITITTQKDEYEFSLRKADQSGINSVEVINPHNRKMTSLSCGYTQSLYVLSGSTLRIQFTQPMVRDSVASIIDEYANLGRPFVPSYSWEDDNNLLLTLTCKEDISSATVLFSLTGAICKNGSYIQDNKGFAFVIVKSDNLYSLNINNLESMKIYDLGLVSTVSLSKNNYLAYNDLIDVQENNGDVPDSSHKKSYLRILELSNNKLVTINDIKKVNRYSSGGIINSGNKYFFYINSIYNVNGEKVIQLNDNIITSAAFSPDQSKIGVLYNRQIEDEFHKETIFSIYDIASKMHLHDISLTTYILDANYQDDYTIVNAKWLTNDTILYESLSGSINSININSLEKESLFTGYYNLFLSPNKQKLITYLNDRKIVIYNISTREQIYCFPEDFNPTNLVWSLDSNSLYFNKGSDNQLYKLTNGKIELIDAIGKPIGFESTDNLLLTMNQ